MKLAKMTEVRLNIYIQNIIMKQTKSRKQHMSVTKKYVHVEEII